MKKRDKANRAYAIGTAVVLVCVLAVSVVTWMFRPVELNEATLCPTSQPIAGHTLVILDRSDKWNPAMGDALTRLVEDAQRETTQHAKFSIVSLDGSLSPHPLFSVCNPGAPTLLSDLYRGHRYTEHDFVERFVGAAPHQVDAFASAVAPLAKKHKAAADYRPGKLL